jgi:hypothetical protein
VLRVLAAVVVCPFDRVLAGMVGAGLGIGAICLYLDLSRAALDLSLVRLGLSTPHDRPLRRAAARGWSVIDTRRLILWRQAGIHPDVIGIRLDRSANAVRGKARRLGIVPPDRKRLRRADPWSLPEPPAGFGFPEPMSAELPAPAAHARPAPETQTAPPNRVAEDPTDPTPPTDDAPPKPAAHSEPNSVNASPVARTTVRDEITTTPHPVAQVTIASATDTRSPDHREPAVTRPADAPTPLPLPVVSRQTPASMPDAAATEDENLTWVGTLAHVIYDKEAVRLIGMRQMGLEHWRRTAAVLGLTPGQLKTIRTRIDLPIDRDRRKFDHTYDPALARLNFHSCGYTLMQERTNPKTGRPGHWFFRRNGSKDWFSLWTQLHVIGNIDKRTYDFSRVPVDLLTSLHSQGPVKESLQFIAGHHDEERACRGHTPPVRSGFPGRPGDEVPWPYARNGHAGRGVAHP